ncbi:Glycosyl transferase, family 14 [Corchorus capsularis]|uniref:Glycosyl transferase, family 14 n=1 Tax=Corchorus capsularis TaxID=210143 RepID=A0A1R3GMF4_COCAP|nr:Glycosyl transferase, family 14 [Corchorus capsularis]
MSVMKRKAVLQKSQIRWKRKVLVALLAAFCLASLALMETQYSRVVSLASLRHRFVLKPKIAFLFIARNRLPLDMVWDAFLKVDWGEASMIEAERILLKHALTDPLNERFVFVSDSCIPLYNFSYTYDYIMSTSTSFVDSFADTKEGRYNPKMDPTIPVYNWRKGSQWVVLTRKHAEVIVNDTTVFPMFQQHCKRRSLPEFWRDRPFPVDPAKEHNCIPDEHYVQTLLAQEGLEGELTRRSLTYSAWDLSASKDRERRGWHPVTYKFSDATPELIQSIKDIDNIHYETEDRREWCSSKGKPSPCFLFARKFTRPAAIHLLNLSILGARPGAKSES